MRLIDQHALRKALEDNICEDCDKDPNCLRCGSCLMDVAIEYIIAAPTIDAVEVVRCKDCRWWERDYQPRYHSDERPCNIVGMGTSPDWFCADGEVREDER